MKFKALKKYVRDMNLCSFCAACVVNCAAYRAMGWESYSCRGKVFLLKSREKGWFTNEDALRDRIFTCTLCRSCDLACDAGYKPSEIFHAARVQMVETNNTPPSVLKLFNTLQETRNPSGYNPDVRIQWINECAGFLDLNSKILFFAGCNAAYKGIAQIRKVLQLLAQIGIKPSALREEQCCGLIAYQLGNLPLAEELAGWNINQLQQKGIEQLIFLCPSCASFISEIYPLLTRDLHINPKMYFELLLEHVSDLKLKDLTGKTVTYHDPCHLGRYMNVSEPPRSIIKKTGAKLVEMDANYDKTACCGGGAGLLAYNLDRSLKVAEARIKEALTTNASIIITPCNTCQETLEGAKFRIDEAMELEVWNLLDLFVI